MLVHSARDFRDFVVVIGTNKTRGENEKRDYVKRQPEPFNNLRTNILAQQERSNHYRPW